MPISVVGLDHMATSAKKKVETLAGASGEVQMTKKKDEEIFAAQERASRKWREVRKGLHHTQYEMAQIVGVHKRTYVRWENTEGLPRKSTHWMRIMVIAKKWGLAIEEVAILCGTTTQAMEAWLVIAEKKEAVTHRGSIGTTSSSWGSPPSTLVVVVYKSGEVERFLPDVPSDYRHLFQCVVEKFDQIESIQNVTIDPLPGGEK